MITIYLDNRSQKFYQVSKDHACKIKIPANKAEKFSPRPRNAPIIEQQ